MDTDKKYERPSKDEYYLGLALSTSKRSTCLRRNYGAIIVLNDSITSTGYNGSCRGAPNCLEHGCLKEKHNVAHGGGYDFCRAGPLHAELNGILNAARTHGGTSGAVMYISGTDGRNREDIVDAYPCKNCRKAIINAGIEKVVIRLKKGIKKFNVEDWAKEAHETEDKDVSSEYK